MWMRMNWTTTVLDNTSCTIAPPVENSSQHDTPWIQFINSYNSVHGYIGFTVCPIGIILNILNIVVLSHRAMQGPINFILTSLAVADIFLMTFYIPSLCLIWLKHTKHKSHTEAYVAIVVVTFMTTAHGISFWLTVVIAIFRYIGVRHPYRAKYLCTMQRAKIAVVTVYVCGILYCLPQYWSYDVKEIKKCNQTYWSVDIYDISRAVNLWLYGSIGKLIPCVLLVVLSAEIVKTMYVAKRNRRHLSAHNTPHHTRESHDYFRTSIMLVTIVLLYCLLEIPLGILSLCAGLSDHIHDYVYQLVGNLVDMLVLINSSVSFMIYCTMSRQFRFVFRRLFFRHDVQNEVTSALMDTEVTRNTHMNGNLRRTSFGVAVKNV